ncbi:MAG: SDR family oxidoreductase [Proteobacteria bacterium]|nr:SDR family oxidoreductase [Pseudomonadota bacterium]
MQTKKTALITGASAGIGKAFAEVFAKNTFDLVLTARREERLLELADTLQQQYGTHVLTIPCDLSDPTVPQQLYDRIASEGLTIDALVNNAGYGVPGYYTNTSWQRQSDFIQVLITAVAHLCHLFLPGMIERGYGRIVNVSSLNGLTACSPGQTLYSGAKGFVIQLSQTLHMEAEGTGVFVSALCPGLTRSEFHDATGTRELADKKPAYMWMEADAVATQAFDAVMAGQPLCINGGINKIFALLARLLPRNTALGMASKASKSFRRETV